MALSMSVTPVTLGKECERTMTVAERRGPPVVFRFDWFTGNLDIPKDMP